MLIIAKAPFWKEREMSEKGVKVEQMKRAILLVSYGVASRSVWTKTLELLEAEVRRAWPDWTVKQAFTGRRILEKCCSEGFCMQNEEQALAELVQDGYEKIVVLPTYMTFGSEYNKVVTAVEGLSFECKMGLPLLGNEVLRRQAAEALIHEIQLADGETALYIGHGTKQEKDQVYELLEKAVQRAGQNTAIIGTLENAESTVARIDTKRVRLVPLLLTAGRHALRDVCGEEAQSIASKFRAVGAEVECIEKGLLEYGSIRRIYLDQLRELICG